jgi:histidinol-phosphate aminotransferase
MLDLHLTHNLLGPSPALRDWLCRHAGRCGDFPIGVARGLERRLAAHHGVDAARILCGAGSGAILQLILSACPGARFVCSVPGYAPAAAMARAAGLRVHGVGLTPGPEGDLPALMAAAAGDGPCVVYLCSPDCFRGSVLSDVLLGDWIACAGPRTLFIVDQAYAEFAAACVRTLPSWAGAENVVLLRTFSKAYALAGLRMGYGVFGGGLAHRLRRRSGPWPVAGLAAGAATEALLDDEWLAHGRALLQVSRSTLGAGLDALGLEWLAGETNFLLHRMPGGRAGRVRRRLEPEVRLAWPGGALGGWCRVTLGTAGVADAYLQCLRRALS